MLPIARSVSIGCWAAALGAAAIGGKCKPRLRAGSPAAKTCCAGFWDPADAAMSRMNRDLVSAAIVSDVSRSYSSAILQTPVQMRNALKWPSIK